MGCTPFGRMISLACEKMRGDGEISTRNKKKKRRKRRSHDHHMHGEDMFPPITTTSISHPMARSVIYSNNHPIVVMQPESGHHLYHHQEVVTAPPPIEEVRHRRVQFAQPEKHQKEVVNPEVHQQEPVVIPGVPGFRYVPSPLPVSHVERRGGDHFGGEYNYYPTPIREGIYRLATDANRLTTLFSEENPNACSIV